MKPAQTNNMPDFCNRRFPFHFITALNLLAGMGVNINNVGLLAVGEYENYKGKVRHQEPKPGTKLTSDTQIRLKVGFKSAVDYMPYQFFYGLHSLRDSDAGWEENSRRLLAPFESAVIRHDAEARYQSLKYDFGIVDRSHLLKILELFNFELPAHFDSIDDILFWISILPAFHYWAGNHSLMAEALGIIFGYEFEIIENTCVEYEIPESLLYHLGNKMGRLGRETILGKSIREYDSGYEIIIKNVKPENIKELLAKGAVRQKIEWLLGICMPNNLDFCIKLKVNRPDVPAGTERTENRRLGYSTYI